MEKIITEITLKAYAKINLSLEVTGRREDGYHNIESLMQGIGLHDVIKITKCAENGTKYNLPHCTICGVVVYLCTDAETIPTDMSNLALKGIKAVLEEYQAQGQSAQDEKQIESSDAQVGEQINDLNAQADEQTKIPGACEGEQKNDLNSHEKDMHTELPALLVTLEKKLPVAAGLAGGSGNGAACMLGINALLGYPFTLKDLMRIGAKVGADVPFSLMMNASCNSEALAGMEGSSEAGTAAWVSGIGETVKPQAPLQKYIVMANPGISVSTRDAYEAIDRIKGFAENPTGKADTVNTDAGTAAHTGANADAGTSPDTADCKDSSEHRLFVNDFEEYVFSTYPEAAKLRQVMTENLSAESVLMSGSGPTMIAYYTDADAASADYDKLLGLAAGVDGWRVWQTVTGDE